MLCMPQFANVSWEQIGKLAARLSCVDDRFADFAVAASVDCGPQTDSERDDMRAVIDVLVARAYGLTIDDLRMLFADYPEGAFTPTYRQLVLEKFEAL